ncbi:cupin-like domain-containing protein [Trinickia sp. LjRoot230]|uniref:cupin-like domain-containing protein n=1 Tax=Trinickia sp. LjRoot230 TaxID=3342288 RepID=UPI003ECF87BB
MIEKIVKVIDLVPGAVRELPMLEAESLNKEEFWDEFVRKHKPVLIKGAVEKWPAVAKWGIPGYLDEFSDMEVPMSQTFNPIPIEPYRQMAFRRQKLSACLKQMQIARDDETYSIPSIPVPRNWPNDLGDYSFLDQHRDLRPRVYPRRRLFIYKNASTEWHYHLTDETLTTQIVGSKRVSLFRLNSENWGLYSKPIEANFHHLSCRTHFFPNENQIVKYEGILNAGDVLYLPPFWWHGIDTADANFGITLAHCFRTPLKRLGDWNEPALKAVMQKQAKLLAYIRIGMPITISSLSRLIARENW